MGGAGGGGGEPPGVGCRVEAGGREVSCRLLLERGGAKATQSHGLPPPLEFHLTTASLEKKLYRQSHQ